MYPLRNKLCDTTWSLVKYHCNCFSTSSLFQSRRKGNYYSHLELGSNATQNEIKTSYYRLSKIYHPDKNLGSQEAANKFREITAAYEVLGNVQSRKLYDRGLASTQSIYEAPAYESAPESDETVSDFHRARHTKKPSKVYTGRTEAYNFDEWTKAHYSSSFNRIQDSRATSALRREMNEAFRAQETDKDLTTPILIVILFAIVIVQLFVRDYYDDPALIVKKNLSVPPRVDENNESEVKPVIP